jgi:hypothetical protein
MIIISAIGKCKWKVVDGEKSVHEEIKKLI